MPLINKTIRRPRIDFLIETINLINENKPCIKTKNLYNLSMRTDIFGTVTVDGVEVPIMGKAIITYQDKSFNHEFGTYVDGNYEVEAVENIEVDGEIDELAEGSSELKNLIISKVNHLDADAFTKKQKEAAINRCDFTPDIPETD